MFDDYNTESEVNEIEGVYQIKISVPFVLKYVCLYLFEIDGEYVLIDAGWKMNKWGRKFFSAVNDIGVDFKDIKYCLLTHSHTDHVGLIKKFKKINPEIQILMHHYANEDIQWESNPKNHEAIEKLARENSKLMVKYGLTEEEGAKLALMMTSWAKMTSSQEADKVLQDNDEISFKTNKLKIIWTPGHSLGHINIFDNNRRFLFSGDHILSRITPHIGNFMINPKISIEQDFTNILDYYLKSLDVIDNLGPKIIFPAHQDIIYDPHKRILEIKKHHDNRLIEISKMIENNPMTPRQISLKHFGELDQMNTYLGLSEILGHLIYLEEEEKVKRIEKDGKYFFVS